MAALVDPIDSLVGELGLTLLGVPSPPARVSLPRSFSRLARAPTSAVIGTTERMVAWGAVALGSREPEEEQ